MTYSTESRRNLILSQQTKHWFTKVTANCPFFFAILDDQHRYILVNQRYSDVVQTPIITRELCLRDTVLLFQYFICPEVGRPARNSSYDRCKKTFVERGKSLISVKSHYLPSILDFLSVDLRSALDQIKGVIEAIRDPRIVISSVESRLTSLQLCRLLSSA